ncbi:MAG: coenzyme transferase, partial [Proteobacteria bacterium]|nr:coenzyme transferase [Pseudomonadota bacterium]
KGVTIPSFYVTAVAEAPYGAHPTACYPFYAYDRRHTAEYYRLASAGAAEFRDGYLNVFIDACPSHADYLNAIGGDSALQRLASWQEGDDVWRQLYA